MTLRMGDGPPGNLPADLDAGAGYVNRSGIGVTWPTIAAMPYRYHLSITTDGAPAMCADVETGAMSDWRGYAWGYCAISNAAGLIARYGRPPKLWTAHRQSGPGGVDDPHICDEACWAGLPAGFKADGTQWTDHGGAWDESLLADDFFELSPPIPLKEGTVIHFNDAQGTNYLAGQSAADDASKGNLVVIKMNDWASWDVMDVTDSLKASRPTDPRTYQIS